jgi:hypothetical protein
MIRYREHSNGNDCATPDEQICNPRHRYLLFLWIEQIRQVIPIIWRRAVKQEDIHT